MDIDSEDEQLLDTLVNRLLEGLASDSEIERLDAILAKSPESIDRYIDLTSIHSMLEWRLGHTAESIPNATAAPNSASKVRPASDVPRRSPVLGFLGDLNQDSSIFSWPNVSSFTPTVWAVLILFAGLAFTASIVAVRSVSNRAGRQGFEIANSKSEIPAVASPNAQGVAHSQGVARVTRMVDCRWIVENAAPTQGQQLQVGQVLHLAAGVVSLDFDIGAKLILQGPAELSILSAKELRLDRGKLAAEITSDKAHGFTVYTPQGKLVDLGTEFGIEIAPEGSSKMHVFRGKVEVSLPPIDGKPALATECLLANGSVRVEAGADTMDLVGDTGESYVRSLDRYKKEQHVVAYWRFEDRPLGTIAPHTDRNVNPIRATVDSSFNGNDLYAWSDESRPKFSGDVARADVPQTTSPNHACLDNTAPVPSYGGNTTSRNVYTHSAFSHASPLDIQKISPAQWTIEASVKPVVMGSSSRTIVGRDTVFPPSWKNTAPPRLALELTADRRFAISFYDASRRFHRAVAEQPPVQANRWYHVAAVSDGRCLKIYVCDRVENQSYRLCASTELPTSGSTALGKGDDAAEWTIGRGLVDGRPGAGAQFQGLIDEVRISDIARKPDELLFSPAMSTRPLGAKSAVKTANVNGDLNERENNLDNGSIKDSLD